MPCMRRENVRHATLLSRAEGVIVRTKQAWRKGKQMRKLLIMALVATGAIGCVIGDDGEETAPQGTQKVMLKISTVETVDTRTQKTWNPPAQPMVLQELPHTEADIANATPEEAAKMAKENRARRLDNQKIQADLALNAYVKAQEHFEGTKKKLEGTVFGRQVILALDKFAGMAGEYFDSDCLQFFHRMDNDEGDKEQFLKDMGSADTLSAPYFIKLVFDNPRIESGKVTMNGQEMKRTKITVAVTYQVQALNGRMATAGNVKKEKVLKTSGAVQRSGADDGALIDTIEEALAEVAKRINSHFVAKVTIKAISSGGKKDEDFDADAATVEIDGVSADLDSEISIMKGNHTIVVNLDEYKQKGSVTFNIKKSGVVKISLKKAPPKKKAKDDE